ncbi:MAG: hypothetical protein JJ975_07520 [Bacteroidia bacterium]|nr:hypothetical protein [Bacteroidia bacterium]
MRTRYFLTCLVFVLIGDILCHAQSVNAYFVGHSLVGHTIPNMLEDLASDDDEVTYLASRQVINGSPLKYNWENPDKGEVGNYRADLATGTYNHLIVTEAVPLINHLTWSNSYNMADSFYSYLNRFASNPTFFVYETWHCINSGRPEGCNWDDNDTIPWRKRLDQDRTRWEGIADSVLKRNLGGEVYLVPGGQAMALLFDEIESGHMTGMTKIEDAFHDDIHLNDTGSYYMACVMYATLFRKSPEGRTVDTDHQWGSYNSPGTILGKQLQELAWRVVCDYDRSGVDCSTNSINNHELNELSIKWLEYELELSSTVPVVECQLLNANGQQLQSIVVNKTLQVNLTKPEKPGIYIMCVRLSDGSMKYYKFGM